MKSGKISNQLLREQKFQRKFFVNSVWKMEKINGSNFWKCVFYVQSAIEVPSHRWQSASSGNHTEMCRDNSSYKTELNAKMIMG